MSKKLKILLAEDETALGMIIKESLETRDFEVDHALSGDKALEWTEKQTYDALVLDVMMPKMDGFTVSERFRKKNQNTPIIFLTSRSRTEDVLEGFKMGGNDYLKKPFSMEELIVRINELIKRNRPKTAEQIDIGSYVFHPTKQLLVFKREEITLTSRESQLLLKLANSVNVEVNRTEILKELWGDDDFFNGRSMDVFITKLRKKLSKDPGIQIINVRGFGYKLIC